jgi:hypothetical protein
MKEKTEKNSLNIYSQSILKEHTQKIHRYHGLPKCFSGQNSYSVPYARNNIPIVQLSSSYLVTKPPAHNY